MGTSRACCSWARRLGTIRIQAGVAQLAEQLFCNGARAPLQALPAYATSSPGQPSSYMASCRNAETLELGYTVGNTGVAGLGGKYMRGVVTASNPGHGGVLRRGREQSGGQRLVAAVSGHPGPRRDGEIGPFQHRTDARHLQPRDPRAPPRDCQRYRPRFGRLTSRPNNRIAAWHSVTNRPRRSPLRFASVRGCSVFARSVEPILGQLAQPVLSICQFSP